MTGTRVLVVGRDPTPRGDLAFTLESSHGFVTFAAAGQAEAIERLATAPFDALLVAAALPDGDAIPVLQRCPHGEPDSPVTVVVAQPGEMGLRRLAWAEGASAVLTAPVDASEVAAALRGLLRARADRIQAAAARNKMAASMDRVTDLLVLVLDAALSGAARRGAEVANLASLLARGFELTPPMLDEMRQAARLHEIGRFAMGRSPIGASTAAAAGHIPMASARLLGDVPCLQEVADLVEGIGADWDGGGVPAGRQRGQIPLRSRLLRVAADLLAEMEKAGRRRAPHLAAAAAVLAPDSGRRYDPAVIAVLEAIVADEVLPPWQEVQAWVQYDGLEEGMELAADLHTVSGVKLLSAGSFLNASNLQLIRHRHQIDPVALPVSVHRRVG